MRRAAGGIVTITVLMLLAGPVHADTQAQLDAAQAKLKKLVASISKEGKVVTSLQGEVTDLAQQLDEVQTELARTQAKVVQSQQAIRQATDDLRATQDQLDQRAWVAYESGPGTSLDFILGSTSLSDLADRLEIVNSAAQTDEGLIQQVESEKLGLTAKQNGLRTLEGQQQEQQTKLQTQQAALESKLAEEQGVLAQLDKDKKSAQSLVTKLKKKRAAEVAAAQAALAAAQHAGSSGGPAIGGVFQACPVDQPHGYSDDFGAPRYGGGFHLHAGNDILAPRGTPIRAPFDGTASNSSNSLGGLSVTVRGAAGYVYNAHLSSFGQLGAVHTGTVIGYVGNTGDAAGGPTHDHFEWHPNALPSHLWTSPYRVSVVGSAIDPFPYLNSVC